MAPGNFPTGIDQKLALEEPDLWDASEFEGHERMAVKRGNTLLQQIFSKTRTDLPKLVASIRWSHLRMPSKDFANAAGMSYNGYKPMEKDIGPHNIPHRSKVTRLLEFWAKNNISHGIREQLLDLLTCPELIGIDESCVDLLSAIEHLRSQSEHLLGVKDITAFYHRVGYECGHEEVTRQFRDKYAKQNIYNTLWQREKTGAVPDCLEVVQLVDTMYAGNGKETKAKRTMRRAQGEAVWSMVKKNQYQGRTIEEPLAQFLVILERDLAANAGITLTAEALRDQYGIGPQDADLLIRTELIATDAVTELAARLMDAPAQKQFLRAWNAAYETEQQRESFAVIADAAMAERGYTPADLAVLLNVQAPEDRGKRARFGTLSNAAMYMSAADLTSLLNVQAKEDRGKRALSERSQRYRGDAEVRGVLYQNRVSSQISVEALVRVLSRDDAHADELRDAYVRERERYFRRNGTGLSGDGLRMRLLRELANVEMNELALHFLPKNRHNNRAAVKEKNLELQRLERAEGKQHRIPFADIFPILQKLADERASEAAARVKEFDVMDESLKAFVTVQQMAANLIKGKKSADNVSDAMRNIAQDDTQWLRSDLILRMSEGKFVPSLLSLRVMAKGAVDMVLPEAVVRDWHEQFPHQLQKGAMDIGTFIRPLPRVLCTLLATKEASAIRFFEKRVMGVVPTHGTKMLRDLEEGKAVEWKYIHKMLLVFGLQPSQIAYRLAKGLYDAPKGDLNSVLAELVPILRGQKMDIHPVNLPGLTLDELKPYQKKGKK